MVYDNALQNAINTITTLKQEKGFVVSQTDCWALICEYHRELTGVDNLSVGSFDSARELFSILRGLGYRSFDDYFLSRGYQVVHSTKPQQGDIIYEKVRTNLAPTGGIAGERYWYSSYGPDRAGPYRKRRPVETTIINHYRLRS